MRRLLATTCLLFGACTAGPTGRGDSPDTAGPPAPGTAAADVTTASPAAIVPPPVGPPGVVTIHVPEGLGQLRLASAPDGADWVRIPCATCHGAAGDDPLRTPPSIASRAGTVAAPTSADPTPQALDPRGVPAGAGPFHAVSLAHGQLPCLSCHDERQRDRLHLADGRTIPFDDVMTLCAQCHGPQTRDYRHGSHGGMNGYWDLTRGSRTRNSCVDCHRPHAPAYRPVMPVFPPRDRWLDGGNSGTRGEH